MNPLLIYMIKVSFCIAAFYFIYSFFLSNDTMYKRNRYFILISVLSALILPFITIQTGKPLNLPFFGKTLSEVLVTGTAGSLQDTSGIKDLNGSGIIFSIYLTGILLLGGKLIIDLLELLVLILKGKRHEDHIIRFRGLNTSGFSAFGKIFINSNLPDKDAEDIIQHEQNHLTYLHFFDIVFIEVVMVIQWFNPFIHLFNRSLRAVHEYQADEGCLNNGITVISYQRLLMNQVFKSKIFGMTNSFSNPTLIKKRMIMMTKKRSTMLANLKLLMVLPAIAIVLIAFSSCNDKSKNESVQINAENKVLMGDKIPVDAPPPPPPPEPYLIQKGDTVWNTPDIMPLYPGGDEALFQFLGKNIKYPEDAKKNGIQGRVIVQFTVNRDGNVEDAKVMKGVSPDLDAEALRVINELPDFDSPGKINGKPVAVSYAVPLSFVLQ